MNGESNYESEPHASDRAAETAAERDQEDWQATVWDQEAKAADFEAAGRDRAAEDRDAMADARDWVAETGAADPSGATVRRRAARDRAAAAEDRNQSVDNRGQARRNRHRSAEARARAAGDRSEAAGTVAYLRQMLDEAEDNAEHMIQIGQAQGRLMDSLGLSSTEALLQLASRAAAAEIGLNDAAGMLIADGPNASASSWKPTR